MKLFRHLSITISASMFLFTLVTEAAANPWAVVANFDATLSTINMGTNPPTVYGPHLSGELGTDTGGLLDLTISHAGDFALVSNFGDSKVFRIDLSTPSNPSGVTSIPLTLFAEDIDIAPDDTWAVVSDGGLSDSIAFIDLATNISSEYFLTSGDAQAVTIAPDGETVLIADYLGSQIIYGPANATRTGLETESVISLPVTFSPVNIAVSPDGLTVLTSGVTSDSTVAAIHVFSLINGELTWTQSIHGIPGQPQSIAFNRNGTRAYILSNTLMDPVTDQISWLNVFGPGAVGIGGIGVCQLLSDIDGSFFGVDTLALSPDGSFLLASNSGSSTPFQGISYVNLTNFAVSSITLGTDFPVGLAMLGTNDNNDGEAGGGGSGGGCFLTTTIFKLK